MEGNNLDFERILNSPTYDPNFGITEKETLSVRTLNTLKSRYSYESKPTAFFIPIVALAYNEVIKQYLEYLSSFLPVIVLINGGDIPDSFDKVFFKKENSKTKEELLIECGIVKKEDFIISKMGILKEFVKEKLQYKYNDEIDQFNSQLEKLKREKDKILSSLVHVTELSEAIKKTSKTKVAVQGVEKLEVTKGYAEIILEHFLVKDFIPYNAEKDIYFLCPQLKVTFFYNGFVINVNAANTDFNNRLKAYLKSFLEETFPEGTKEEHEKFTSFKIAHPHNYAEHLEGGNFCFGKVNEKKILDLFQKNRIEEMIKYILSCLKTCCSSDHNAVFASDHFISGTETELIDFLNLMP